MSGNINSYAFDKEAACEFEGVKTTITSTSEKQSHLSGSSI